MLFVLLFLSGCGMWTTGNGTFTGTIVDVEWGGLLFKSCEAGFQYGNQSSSLSHGSSRDKEFCDLLKSKTGEKVTVEYKSWVRPCCLTMDTAYEMKPEIKEGN